MTTNLHFSEASHFQSNSVIQGEQGIYYPYFLSEETKFGWLKDLLKFTANCMNTRHFTYMYYPIQPHKFYEGIHL